MKKRKRYENMAVKMLNVPSLPNIPWQEKPADYKLSSPVWRVHRLFPFQAD